MFGGTVLQGFVSELVSSVQSTADENQNEDGNDQYSPRKSLCPTQCRNSDGHSCLFSGNNCSLRAIKRRMISSELKSSGVRSVDSVNIRDEETPMPLDADGDMLSSSMRLAFLAALQNAA